MGEVGHHLQISKTQESQQAQQRPTSVAISKQGHGPEWTMVRTLCVMTGHCAAHLTQQLSNARLVALDHILLHVDTLLYAGEPPIHVI